MVVPGSAWFNACWIVASGSPIVPGWASSPLGLTYSSGPVFAVICKRFPAARICTPGIVSSPWASAVAVPDCSTAEVVRFVLVHAYRAPGVTANRCSRRGVMSAV